MELFIELSDKTDDDLEEIFHHTLEHYGIDQAVRYVSSFDEIFETIASSPDIGQVRNELIIGLRSIVRDSHVTFYKVLEDRIRIVRIIHSSRDLPKQFS